MNDNFDVDAYAVVGEHWPYDGPYAPETLASASLAVSRLLRYLNNATTKQSALPYAAAAGAVLSNVSSAINHLPQLLVQLEDFIERQVDEPTLYDDRRDRPGAETALELVEALKAVRDPLARFGQRLNEAAVLADHLGNDV